MWKTVKLEDIFKIGSSKRVLKAEWKDSGVPFYRGREITTLSKTGAVDNDLFISEEHFSKLKANHGFPQSGDLLVTAIGTIGNTYIVREQDRFYFKDASVLWLHKISDVDSRFVNYWFNSSLFYTQLEVGNGATVDTLSISKLKAMNFILPPLPEQERIVAKLDAAFAEIDEAVSLAQYKIADIQSLKNTLLASNLSNTKTTEKLGDVIEIARGGSPRPIKSFITTEDDGVNWIKIGDTKQGGKYISTTKEKIKPSGVSHSRYVKENDFLLSNSMSFGRPYILKTTGCIHDGWLVLSKYQESFIADYLYYLLSSSLVQNQFKSLARGSTVRNLNIELVSQVTVPILPLTEQQRVVAKLDVAYSALEMANDAMEKSKRNYQALKAAILSQELQPSEAA